MAHTTVVTHYKIVSSHFTEIFFSRRRFHRVASCQLWRFSNKRRRLSFPTRRGEGQARSKSLNEYGGDAAEDEDNVNEYGDYDVNTDRAVMHAALLSHTWKK